MKEYRVVWDIKAKESLKEIVLFLRKESPLAASKVRVVLLQLAASLKQMPERFSAEVYLEHKGPAYRSVSRWNYKIVYRIHESDVWIVDIIHTKRNTMVFENIG